MKHLLILAGVAALATTAPAIAKPDHAKGKGQHGQVHGKGYGKAHGKHGVNTALYAPGIGGCPPGLAKKNNGCLPPGQAKRLYAAGQRWPGNYGQAWNYNQIPYDLRTHYGFQPGYNYYYGDGYIYRVDPATMLISQAVSAILR